jgi:hypothetical protein
MLGMVGAVLEGIVGARALMPPGCSTFGTEPELEPGPEPEPW